MTTKDSLHLKLPWLLSPRGQRGLEAKLFGFGLGLVVSSLGLVLVLVITNVFLVASLSAIKITSFTLRSFLIGNCCLLYRPNILLKLTME